MPERRKSSALIALAAVTSLAACASDDDWSQATPESQGYAWVGTGEPGNFASAFNFCRGTVGAASAGQRVQDSGGDATLGIPGGPNTLPGYSRSGVQTRSDFPDRRQFAGCMESQGWAQPQPTPAAPAPTTPSTGRPGPGPATPPSVTPQPGPLPRT